ncbi:hypothetical protein [Sanguibacter sp. HDW7]|uniref:hypothetical protein n=1 Tax=Sanguibacter sp. HDW7 TaxID=2714931 RepID=UPI00140799A0|nr:hypothetical protein [Sanguibacter sp. HDW7]QIK82853.1 hypothetical protein G7063_03845 [Sanguibacter sp. HDW7]
MAEPTPRKRRGARPTEPLGSLSAPVPSLPGTRECAGCGGRELTRVDMTLADGTDVVFVSCHGCEETSWVDAAGTVLDADDVLPRMRRPGT